VGSAFIGATALGSVVISQLFERRETPRQQHLGEAAGLICGSSYLSLVWASSVRPPAVGGKHDSQPMIIKVFQAGSTTFSGGDPFMLLIFAVG
jgi:hypothetical protein